MSSAMPRVAILITVPSKPASPISKFEPPPRMQQRFLGRVQIPHGVDQFGFGLGNDHPACRTAHPEGRVVCQQLSSFDRLRAHLGGLGHGVSAGEGRELRRM